MSTSAPAYRTLVRLLLASPAVFGLAAAHAQTADPAPAAAAAKPAPVSGKELPLQKVQVQGSANTYDARRNDTATKIVVSQEEILKNGDTTVGEVLKRLPGITIGGVQGRGGEIRMRGLGSGYTQILLNGEPSPPGFSLDSITPDMIERIEIMRSATAELSAQAIAGAINIVLKRAIQTAQRELKIGAQDDSGYPGTSVNFQLSDRAGPFSYSIGGGAIAAKVNRPSHTIESDTDASGAPSALRTNELGSDGHFEQLNLAPRVNWTLAPGDVLTSQTFLVANRYNGHSSEQITTELGAPPAFAATRSGIKSDFTLFRTDLNWTRKLAEGAKLDFKAGVNYNKRDTKVDSLHYDNGGSLVQAEKIDSSASDKGLTASGKYSTPIIENHSLVFGWDGAYSKRDESRLQRETPSTVLRPDNLNQSYQATVSRLALFAQDEWAITPRWSLYYGLRWEGLDTKSDGSDYASIDNKSSVWSPVLQTLWKLPDSKNDQLRLGLSRTYKAPSTGNLIPRRFTATNNTATTPDSQGNPELRPELAWGIDLAYEHYLADGGLLSASTFARRIDNITHSRVSQIDGLWVSMPVNDGVANTHGIELEAKLPLRSLYKTAPAIEVRANLTRTWSTLSSVPGPNNRLDSQTPLSANFGLDYKLDTLPLTMGGNFSFQNGGPVRISTEQFAYSVPKRSLDLYGLWKFSPKTQLRVSLANVLHQDNIVASSYINASGTQQLTTITPTTTVVRAMLEMKL